MFKNILEDWNSAEPVFRQIASFLKDEILSGKYSDGTKLPPETNLARLLKVNRMTLRKSLNILTDQKLLTQQQGRGTFISCKTERKLRLGIVNFVPDQFPAKDFYSSEIYMGAFSSLCTYPMLLISLIPWILQQNKDELYRKVSEYDALLVPGYNRDALYTLLDPNLGNIPRVFLSTSSQKIRNAGHVCLDLKKGEIEKAVKRLHEQGHRRIAFCCSQPTTEHFKDRADTFLRCVKKYGLDFTPDYYYIWNGNFYECSRDFCLRVMKGAKPPTAIISGTTAYGILIGAMQMGLRIPDDLSIIGFDERDNPMIANLKQPVFQMTQTACAILVNAVTTGNLPKVRHMLYETELSANASIGKVRTSDSSIFYKTKEMKNGGN